MIARFVIGRKGVSISKVEHLLGACGVILETGGLGCQCRNCTGVAVDVWLCATCALAQPTDSPSIIRASSAKDEKNLKVFGTEIPYAYLGSHLGHRSPSLSSHHSAQSSGRVS